MRTLEKEKVSLPSDTEVRVTRDFAAPRQLVWDAHTKPELVRRWMLEHFVNRLNRFWIPVWAEV